MGGAAIPSGHCCWRQQMILDAERLAQEVKITADTRIACHVLGQQVVGLEWVRRRYSVRGLRHLPPPSSLLPPHSSPLSPTLTHSLTPPFSSIPTPSLPRLLPIFSRTGIFRCSYLCPPSPPAPLPTHAIALLLFTLLVAAADAAAFAPRARRPSPPAAQHLAAESRRLAAARHAAPPVEPSRAAPRRRPPRRRCARRGGRRRSGGDGGRWRQRRRRLAGRGDAGIPCAHACAQLGVHTGSVRPPSPTTPARTRVDR